MNWFTILKNPRGKAKLKVGQPTPPSPPKETPTPFFSAEIVSNATYIFCATTVADDMHKLT